jgi:hypothetical protein
MSHPAGQRLPLILCHGGELPDEADVSTNKVAGIYLKHERFRRIG